MPHKIYPEFPIPEKVNFVQTLVDYINKEEGRMYVNVEGHKIYAKQVKLVAEEFLEIKDKSYKRVLLHYKNVVFYDD